MSSWARAVVAGAVVAFGVAACGQSAPPASPPTETSGGSSAVEGVTPVISGTAFTPTEVVGGSAAVTDVAAVFAAVQQASQLRISANATPPGATGTEVTSVSVVAQDTGGLLKGLDAAGKRSLGDALLTAAGTAWPNASVSLLISDPAGSGGTVIGNRPKGGPNTVIAT